MWRINERNIDTKTNPKPMESHLQNNIKMGYQDMLLQIRLRK